MLDNRVEKAVQIMLEIANNNTSGYDQQYRWGEYGDYDCSSLTIIAFEKSGFPVKSKYNATYTGDMKQAFIKVGFKDIRNQVNVSTGDGLKRGDILLNQLHHVAVYIGNNKLVQASINELGGVRGGKAGDQTGFEISQRQYYKYKYDWDTVLRYEESQNTKDKQKMKNNKKGSDEVPRVIQIQSGGKIPTVNSINVDNREYVSIRDLAKLGIIKLDYDIKNKRPIIEKAD